MVQVISVFGAVAILVAYAANQFRLIGPSNLSYILLNLLGAGSCISPAPAPHRGPFHRRRWCETLARVLLYSETHTKQCVDKTGGVTNGSTSRY